MANSASRSPTARYDANYGEFQTELYAEIRREAFDEDIEQTVGLHRTSTTSFWNGLTSAPGKILLDVGCGAGAPALRIAAITGCSVVGVDVHEQAIATAVSLAAQRGFAKGAKFHVANASGPLPFSEASFDAITCLDSINHLPDRRRIIADWARVLKPVAGPSLAYTQPIPPPL